MQSDDSIHRPGVRTTHSHQQSQTSQLWLIDIAVAVLYVILGMLYESWIHPVTSLLGIPPAAAGALPALRFAGMEVSFIA